MDDTSEMLKEIYVALLAEGVDRNTSVHPKRWMSIVALLAEGVDRNYVVMVSGKAEYVALLAEGVDRNRKPRSSRPAV